MIGVWTGCGFDTIPVLLPPPNILGYDACVGMVVSNPPEPVGVAQAEDDGDDVFVII